MTNQTTSGVPPLAGLSPHFSVTVLECPDPSDPDAFTTLRRFLRDTLSEPGRAHAVRVHGEVALSGPDYVDGLGTLSDLGFDELYLAVRQRWQSPRWTDDGMHDLTNELTVALRRHQLVALHTSASGALLRRWTRSAGAPYRFLPDAVLDAFDQESRGAIDVSPAWSRLTSAARPVFQDYLTSVTEALDLLEKVAQNTPGESENQFE
ncbi:MAG: hypothetical protein GEV28_38210 [Actinophytocola sp.]|uniref:hypothetical protein n=1 Tax=Actinophytocola sp. TaxID=1872138 RepID=UPI00132C7B5C|nr:hypothetical protein [Actinophytocola sp.]MPZ85903.1 hypothetical protein [Actinophytocola sp.]